ncbi:MAG: hypothetical protein C75L2_00800022 [Leptospirillum sp. Group II 'C75']|jgi:hypothetical protein|nr:MAG: hypothetical protein C75L2_00800022 [Leptospirillum sp. Group II 'C75']
MKINVEINSKKNKIKKLRSIYSPITKNWSQNDKSRVKPGPSVVVVALVQKNLGQKFIMIPSINIRVSTSALGRIHSVADLS